MYTKNRTRIRVGVWGYDQDEESSNWKEFKNVLLTIQMEVENGGCFRSELFLFVDNSVVEAAYDKGNSSSKALFDLVVELKVLEFHSESVFHIIHVSGKRMIVKRKIDGNSKLVVDSKMREGENNGI